MPRSVPDDDIMDEQQSLDLGHPTKSQPQQAKDLEKETPGARIESDTRANRGLGTLIPPHRESETQEALERAAYTGDRLRARRTRAFKTETR